MGERICVVLADDHALVLEGLRGLLERQPDMALVGAVSNGEDLLDLLATERVDVVVLDLLMPYHGLQVLAEIRRRQIPVRVLVLTAFCDGESIQAALEQDAEGIALKTELPSQTIEAIRQVMRGQLVYPRAAQRWLAARPSASVGPLAELSEREEDVLSLIADGCTNHEIAAQLSISENTVRYHLKNIFGKLGVTNRTEAAGIFLKTKVVRSA
ncbi:MAG: response regulator transcription factor [Caldilineaceae bacterium]|nr:response regulator transcription factor [Caldilineaceae bacterium]